MSKEEVIKILEDYEFFVDDDWGGHYEHINCSQRALTPLGIVEILDYITNLEQQNKKYQEAIDKIKEICASVPEDWTICGVEKIYEIEEALKEVSE